MQNLACSLLPISLVVLTFNEEQNIARTLDSVKQWVGEIFIVDSGSTDQTLAIAQYYTNGIFHHEFIDYAKQRNWTQQNLPFTYEWVMHLDADEQVSAELVAALHNAFAGDLHNIDGFLLKRRTIFLGHWIKHGGHYPSYHLRLYRRQKGYCEERAYDQHFKVDGPVQKLYGDIIDNVTSDLRRWTLSHERWAGQEVLEYFHKHKAVQADRQVTARLLGTPIERRRWLRKVVYARIPLFIRPFIYFFVRYFLLLGFLDGTAGLVFHFLQGFWFRFYIDAKIWEAKEQHLQRVLEPPIKPEDKPNADFKPVT